MRCRRQGARISMIKFLILVVGLLFVAVPLEAAQAQNGGLISPPPNQTNQGLVNPRFQSFNPLTPGDRTTGLACGVGSQSIRVCQNDFQACNSACSATSFSDPIAGGQPCTQNCCSHLQACFSIRGCGNLVENDCFSPTNPSVRALRQ